MENMNDAVDVVEVCPFDSAPMLKPWTYESLDWTKFKFDGSVSTATHSVPYVARHLAAYVKRKRAIEAAALERAARKATPQIEETPNTDDKVSLREQAFDSFSRQMKVSEVAKKLEITYGNAHYYYRQWAKSN